jgi:glucoamylase
MLLRQDYTMAKFRGNYRAFGQPGMEPRWARGDKEGVGTAYSAASRIWFTLWNGVVTEVYYPTVDKPQLRDLQLLITDGRTFFHEEKRNLKSKTERISPKILGYKITNSDPENRYQIVKEIITNPHQPCVMQRVRLRGEPKFLAGLKFYALCAPHLEVGGMGNNGYVMDIAGRQILVAEKNERWMALASNIPFSKLSVGYVGESDGWTDLNFNYKMDWEFDLAPDGNIALTGELALGGKDEFLLGLALGDSLHNAITTLFQSLDAPFDEEFIRFDEQWGRPFKHALPLEKVSTDKGKLFHGSYSLLLAHEDKTYPGAFIASLAIPWGESKGDEDQGGYHLVWTRDMVNSATGLLAAGNKETPIRALIYLAVSQLDDGGFAQNFWIDGERYFRAVQLDEIAFPIILAWRLLGEDALRGFDPYPMVLKAAGCLTRYGPATQQERWEEASGYSPSTLASNIAALICAASFARLRGDETTALYLEEYADFLACHIESWTVTTEGTLVPGIDEHFIRIHPLDIRDSHPDENPNNGMLTIANQPPGHPWSFPAKEIVDAGFLELVRYGIRPADDPIIVNSLRVVDAVLKIDTPYGPCWHRYNHDGYGQRHDGGPYETYGKGRAWPLLVGERAHYELAAGHDVKQLVKGIEGFASATRLLPEQVWDEADLPAKHMYLGHPTGSAMPLMWAHAEYIKLLRSIHDGKVFDFIPAVAERYISTNRTCRMMEIWKPNRQPKSVNRGYTLRIEFPSPFMLHWTKDEWRNSQDTMANSTAIGNFFVDIPIDPAQKAPIRFTFRWTTDGRWQGYDYEVDVI